MARTLHAVKPISSDLQTRLIGLTKCDDVADETEDAHIKVTVLDVFSATEERYCNWDRVTGCQTNDTDARESVERCRGSEVDDAKDDLDDHTEHHSIQWNIELWVDLSPPLRTWNSSVARESPCAARCSSRASDTTEDGKDQ